MENREIINKRIRNIKLVALICGLLLMFKFLVVTVYYQDGFSDLAKYQSTVEVTQTLPRGEIYDSEGTLLAGNKLTYDLEYIEPGVKSEEELFADAQKITQIVDIDSSDLKDEAVKDIWLAGETDGKANSTLVLDRLSDKEAKEYSDLYDDESNDYRYVQMNEILYEHITDEEVQALKDEYGSDVLYVKSLMPQSTKKTPVVIKKDISLEEMYEVDSQMGDLGGFIVMDNWQRYYPEGNTLKSFIGSVGNIPEEDQTKYESQGYSLDEQVGVSYLEKEQESILHSTPQQMECYFDENGNLVRTEITDDGELGNDIQLTINIKFQKYVEEILKKQLRENDYSLDTHNYAVVSDPKTGNLLALAGMIEDDEDSYTENSIGTFTSAYPIGSIVKPAVLLMGYDLGKWEWDTVVTDEPMYIKGTPTKASYHNYGDIDEIEALAVSSNVYFYKLLLAIAGETYVENEALDIKSEYFDLVRSEFEQFGLGTTTGIQMENETLGVRGSDYQPGFYLDLANGQYDTYTPLQAGQYVATLANGGTRYRVNYLDRITTAGSQGSLGKTVYEQDPIPLNHLSMSAKDIAHAKEGMEACYSRSEGSGHTGGYRNLSVPSACKTGTSEDFVYSDADQEVHAVNNASFLGYAPADDPEFAMAIMMPAYTSDDYYIGRHNGSYYGRYIQEYYFKEIKKW